MREPHWMGHSMMTSSSFVLYTLTPASRSGASPRSSWSTTIASRTGCFATTSSRMGPRMSMTYMWTQICCDRFESSPQ